MSKFEAELRLPCKQPYAYISVWIRGETLDEFEANLAIFDNSYAVDTLTGMHSGAYDVVMGTKKPAPNAQALIESELGGKVIEEVTNTAPDDSMKAYNVKPWERPKPAAKADPNDPFANFK